MTRILAIETASADVAVALAEPGAVMAMQTLRTNRGQAEHLHLMVESVLAATGTVLGEIDAIAVDVGPGLFTGIRVGLAAAKGFALALGLPVVGRTSLEVLAGAVAPGAAGRYEAVAIVDLRRGEVAWRLPAGQGSAVTVGHGPPDELVKLLADLYGGDSFLVAGDGALRYAEQLGEALPGLVTAGPELASAPVASLAMQALHELASGRVTTAAHVAPVYLRDADVRIGWTTRHDAPRRGGA